MTTATKARACDGKRIHWLREQAVAHMARLCRLGASPVGMNVYECPIRPFGQRRHWHVGHKPGRRRT